MSTKTPDIKEKFKRVCAKIQKESAREKTGLVRLLAVSKKQDPAKIKILYDLGHREFGENYSQEMAEKAEALEKQGCKKLRWVYIGQLQSNKIKKIVEVASEIQGLATLKHAKLIERYALELGKSPFPVYFLLNTGSEKSKGGLTWNELDEFRQKVIEEMPGLELQGLIAIPPKIDLQLKPMEYYEELYTKLCLEARKTGKGLLSLGMSSDLELALKHGSDCVRVGTEIFGKRKEN